jgi:hypothetical protein
MPCIPVPTFDGPLTGVANQLSEELVRMVLGSGHQVQHVGHAPASLCRCALHPELVWWLVRPVAPTDRAAEEEWSEP